MVSVPKGIYPKYFTLNFKHLHRHNTFFSIINTHTQKISKNITQKFSTVPYIHIYIKPSLLSLHNALGKRDFTRILIDNERLLGKNHCMD